jgi:hypothetical protein
MREARSILDIQGPPEAVVEVENRRIGIFSQDMDRQLREFYRVVHPLSGCTRASSARPPNHWRRIVIS